MTDCAAQPRLGPSSRCYSSPRLSLHLRARGLIWLPLLLRLYLSSAGTLSAVMFRFVRSEFQFRGFLKTRSDS